MVTLSSSEFPELPNKGFDPFDCLNKRTKTSIYRVLKVYIEVSFWLN